MPPTCCPRAEELGCSQPHVVLLQLKLLINRFHFFVFLSSCTAASSFPSQVSVLFLALNAAVEVPGPKTSGGARVAQSRQQQARASISPTYLLQYLLYHEHSLPKHLLTLRGRGDLSRSLPTFKVPSNLPVLLFSGGSYSAPRGREITEPAETSSGEQELAVKLILKPGCLHHLYSFITKEKAKRFLLICLLFFFFNLNRMGQKSDGPKVLFLSLSCETTCHRGVVVFRSFLGLKENLSKCPSGIANPLIWKQMEAGRPSGGPHMLCSYSHICVGL